MASSAFQLNSVLGMLYTGGNVCFSPDGSSLLSPVQNYISSIHMQQGGNASYAASNSAVQCFDVSPDGDLLIAIGKRGLGFFYSISARVCLDTISLPPSCSVACVKFSPCSRYIAVALENTLQVYTCPARRIVSFHGCHRVENVHAALTLPIRTIEWTSDSNHLLIAGGDARIKILPRDVRNRKGLALCHNNLVGHRSAVVCAAFMDTEATHAISIASDNALILWRQTDVTRKELLHMIAAQKLEARVERGQRGKQSRRDPGSDDADEDGDEEDEEGLVPDSFLERGIRDDLVERGVKVSNSDDTHLPAILRNAFEIKKKLLLQHKGLPSVATYHQKRALLAIGYNSGLFAVHSAAEEECPLIHLLSISAQSLTASAFSPNGDYIAFGSEHLKQLLVWDWKAESYVLKEQSHYYDIAVTAMNHDGSTIISGGDDGKLKVWQSATGQCFVTFTEHTSAITGIAVSTVANAFYSCSKDGTVRGYDLGRYRNFRVMTPPQPTQLSCVALDASAEIVVAGSSRNNDVYLWSTQTGKIIDTFAGHSSPVTAVSFHPAGTTLVSGSLDKSLVFWNIFSGNQDGARMRGENEPVQMNSDVLAVAFSHNGRRCAVLTLSGEITVFDTVDATDPHVIVAFSTASDAAGGWVGTTGPNSASANAHFTTIAFSPEGERVIAGGESKWICLYHATQGFLVKKWPVTSNQELQGAEEQYPHRKQTEAGIVDDIDVDDDDIHLRRRKLIEMPGAKHRHFATGKRKTALAARAMHLCFADHGNDFVAATTDGLLLFSKEVSRRRFAPLQLTADITPARVRALLVERRYSPALAASLALQDEPLGVEVLRSTPREGIPMVVAAVPTAAFATFLNWVSREVASSPFVQHALLWAKAALTFTSEPLFGHTRAVDVPPALKLLHRALAQHQPLRQSVDANFFTLQFLISAVGTERSAA